MNASSILLFMQAEAADSAGLLDQLQQLVKGLPVIMWPIVLAGLGLWLMLPRSGNKRRTLGAALGIIGLGLLASEAPFLADMTDQFVFWILAAVTVVAAVATITMRSAVYAAIWFALSLLGTSGLFFFQGSQFIGVATIVVYAGAIVVTFLFVIMLAQPEGHDIYDRISWGQGSKFVSVLAAASLAGLLAFSLGAVRDDLIENGFREQVAKSLSGISEDQLVEASIDLSNQQQPQIYLTFRSDVNPAQLSVDELRAQVESLAASRTGNITPEILISFQKPHQDLLHHEHMAHFGAQLFSRHLVSVEAAGALLLAALVGAVSILIQGREPRQAEGGSGR